jgi:diguanylate cyclase (GGDEF)-like protein
VQSPTLKSPPLQSPNPHSPPSAAEGPFRRAGLLRRSLPFVAVAVIAEASLALQPGPTSSGYTAVSVALMAAVFIAVALLPWSRLPPTVTVVVPLASVGAILTLILATRSATSGIGIVILLPLIWSALFHRRWESIVVVAAIVSVEIITSLTPLHLTNTDLLRRVVFWAAVGLLITIATHDLRSRIRNTLAANELALQRTIALVLAARELTTILNSDDVLVSATRLAAQLVSPSGSRALSLGRRAQYTRVVGGTVTMVTEYDETGLTVTADFPLADHPNLAEVMRTGAATNRPTNAGAAGPKVKANFASLGLTNAVYVPVRLDGEIDGVLSVSTRGEAVSPELFEYCKAVGHITELALENARSHERLAEQATTDDLTGLPNRRAFETFVVQRPGRLPFCVLALDLDGLKRFNDSQGHGVGDALLIHVAQVVTATMRQGDVFARLGGDEFAAVLFNADERDGAEVATRILGALAAAPFQGESLGMSIGIASDGADSVGMAVLAAADTAMYRAKRKGGRCFVLGSSVDGDVPPTAAPPTAAPPTAAPPTTTVLAASRHD